LNSREAATYVRMHHKTLESMARLGLVPATKIGKCWYFRLSSLSEWINNRINSNTTNHAAPTQEERSE
jgi:hypothetical protein